MDNLKMESGWKERLSEFFLAPPMKELKGKLGKEKSQFDVYPSSQKIFAAFDHTPWKIVKVVILGQDPYHGPGQANGLCFSVEPEFRPLPPSLRNIYKELNSDLDIPICSHGDLSKWAKQGVLLLNNVLTVRRGEPQSHQKMGWEFLTDQVVRILSAEKENLVFLLWGSSARKKAADVDRSKHLILECAHPSPLSYYRGFEGCKHFSKTNDYLIQNGQTAIDWNPCGS